MKFLVGNVLKASLKLADLLGRVLPDCVKTVEEESPGFTLILNPGVLDRDDGKGIIAGSMGSSSGSVSSPPAGAAFGEWRAPRCSLSLASASEMRSKLTALVELPYLEAELDFMMRAARFAAGRSCRA